MTIDDDRIGTIIAELLVTAALAWVGMRLWPQLFHIHVGYLWMWLAVYGLLTVVELAATVAARRGN